MPTALFDHPYVSMLTNVLEVRTSIMPLGSYPLPAPTVYLRHDVELSLPSALRIATLESELEISATYLFSLRSPFFNLLSSDSINIVGQIQDMGHEVGLHHVPHGPISLADLAGEIGLAAEILPGFDERLVSIHAPRSLTDPDLSNISQQLERVYGPLWGNEVEYISDSSGEWRDSGIADLLAGNVSRSVQLLLHPYWWDAGPRTPADRKDDLGRLLSGTTLDGTRTIESFLPRLGRM